jgi:hypothetical protein
MVFFYDKCLIWRGKAALEGQFWSRRSIYRKRGTYRESSEEQAGRREKRKGQAFGLSLGKVLQLG